MTTYKQCKKIYINNKEILHNKHVNLDSILHARKVKKNRNDKEILTLH